MSRKDTRENVRVVCRVRPQNEKEVQVGGVICVRLTDTDIDVKMDDGS